MTSKTEVASADLQASDSFALEFLALARVNEIPPIMQAVLFQMAAARVALSLGTSEEDAVRNYREMYRTMAELLEKGKNIIHLPVSAHGMN